VAAFAKKARARIAILKADTLSTFPWLIHGFSTRLGGSSKAYGGHSLNLGFTGTDARASVERNRSAFLRELGMPPRKVSLVTLRQVHSSVIYHVDKVPEHHLVGDGVITNTPGLLLAIQTADCLPVLLIDPVCRAVGAFHAGWRGTLARIVEKGAGEMRRCFGTDARDLHVAIGPGVHNCCYEVGEELQQQFEAQFRYAADLFRQLKEDQPLKEKYPLLFLTARPPGHGPREPERRIFFDLVEANRRQLLDLGVRKKNIFASDLCTSCRNDLLFSYRKEKGVTGRLMGVVGIKAAVNS
jgi:purine-nucleoside/S-methyl-5'-thioadenosine phosphorylase / adenosine deaminase